MPQRSWAPARRRSLSVNGQMISVMVALGESGLRVLDTGDGAGPDSRGLFQQRDNGAWGSYADRMDPTTSATNFIKALKGVAGWELLEPTIAGNRVQRNADPYHYQKYWPEAVKLVQALSNSKFSLQGSDCAIPGQSGAGDDYPWKNSRPGCRSAQTRPAPHRSGMYYRECVDFALWRVNQQMGSTSAPFKFLNGSFRPDGQGLGSALTWKARLGRQGLGLRQHTPGRRRRLVRARRRRSGPELRPRRGGQGSQGQRDLRRRGLQRQPGPGGPRYYTRTVTNTVPSAFLYLPTQEEKK